MINKQVNLGGNIDITLKVLVIECQKYVSEPVNLGCAPEVMRVLLSLGQGSHENQPLVPLKDLEQVFTIDT